MDDIQATAKWANRVLRPLTSIYRRLEKHQETLAIIAAESKVHNRIEDPHRQNLESSQPANPRENYFGSDADEDDPVWIPGKGPDKRRLKHKYSARGREKAGRRRTRLSVHSPEATRVLPGAIELATPLITGKRWEMPSSVRSQPAVEQNRVANARGQVQVFRDRYALHKSPWQEVLDQSGDSGFADIAHNLDRVLLNFLGKTRINSRDPIATTVKPARGARSLLSMVARRLPEYIAIEQEAHDEEDEDGDEDMCDAYFTELESFYAPHGKGWKPLREAVRAQGIHMVSTMIRNRWLTDPVAYALIENCRPHEQDACETLLSTFLSTCTACPFPIALKPTTDNVSPGDSVRLLHRYAYYDPPRRSYIFDELSKLLVRGVLPPEWMATKPWTTWMTRATISFSRADGYCAASSRLIEAVLVSASGIYSGGKLQTTVKKRPTSRNAGNFRATRTSAVPTSNPDINWACPVPVEDALSNHVTSLLATLCGMHISRSRELDNEVTDGTRAGHVINYISFAAWGEMDGKPLSHISILPSHQLLRRGCILLAGCLLQCSDAILAGRAGPVLVSTAAIEEYSNTLVSRSDLIKELGLFVRQAFRCFSSSSNEDTDMRSEIRRIVSQLPRRADAPCLSAFLSRVAVEAAMQFAEGTGDPDDHLWAVEIQETTVTLQDQKESSTELASETEEPGPRRGLFRWEDSIGEWVARTPAVKTAPTTTSGVKRRAFEMSNFSPCIRGSTEISSPGSDYFENSNSITSSPSSVGTERQMEAAESSPIRSFKRRYVAPEVVIEQRESLSDRSPSRSSSKSPSLEPVPFHRRVLRDMSNHITTNPIRAVPLRSASKLEVVIFTKQEPRPPARPAPAPEFVEKQVHRSMNRRRPGRPSLSRTPGSVLAPRRQSVIPCSQDDSDDELSFF
ncbi:hypothetical protein N7490_004762 [Penicillium lividum]|nr:hypothetical protein N7490_004762 [Penicillium lividum]